MTQEPYRLQVSSRARRDLHRLPHRVAVAVAEFLTVTLTENPMRLGKPLTGDLAAYRSARRGDYRALIRVDEPTRTVLVVRVAHRAHAYRPL
ncbi:MAG: type II toxin-antitoxin system RelE family toxin [Mycobacteriales bacterium]